MDLVRDLGHSTKLDRLSHCGMRTVGLPVIRHTRMFLYGLVPEDMVFSSIPLTGLNSKSGVKDLVAFKLVLRVKGSNGGSPSTENQRQS